MLVNPWTDSDITITKLYKRQVCCKCSPQRKQQQLAAQRIPEKQYAIFNEIKQMLCLFYSKENNKNTKFSYNP